MKQSYTASYEKPKSFGQFSKTGQHGGLDIKKFCLWKFCLCLSAAQMSKRCPAKGAIGLNTLEGHVIACYFLRRLIGVL